LENKNKRFLTKQKRQLIEILRRTKEDEIYKAKQLGEAGFLTFLGHEADSSFIPQGRIGCNACNAFFNDTELVEKVRQNLQKEGISKAYKRYAKEVDITGFKTDLEFI